VRRNYGTNSEQTYTEVPTSKRSKESESR